ncbi:MAG: hypothetical protein P8Y23_14200, partial [Candidatus Lokiarchaeota archaeon]
MPFVNENLTGIFGHSMGYIVAFQLAIANPDIDACAFQSFPPLPLPFLGFAYKNVLHLWAQYEEFYTFTFAGPSPYEGMTVPEIYQMGLNITGQNAGLSGLGAVDTTYGDFSLGTAYREHYALGITHPGLTMDEGCNREIVAWILQALMGYTETDAWNTVTMLGQFYFGAEIFSGIALFFSFISMIFLYQLLISSKFFTEVTQPMPTRVSMVTNKKWLWWTFAAINAAISGVVYIYFTHADVNWGFQSDPSSPLVMGIMNNYLGFYLISAAIAGVFVIAWGLISHYTGRDRINLYDTGLIYGEESFVSNLKSRSYWRIFGKTLLVVFILVLWMYLIVGIFQSWFLIEFRVFWSFMKMFTIERFWVFLLYVPLFLPFFLINGGVFLFGELRQKEASSPMKT